MGSIQNIETGKQRLKVDLPVLPHTFLLAMGLSRQADKITIEEVVEVIELDPGAVARVLKVVNSAYYGLRNEVTSLQKAVVGLGPQAVLGLVMSTSLTDMKEHLHITTSNSFHRLLRHSVAVGYLAKQIVGLSCISHGKVSDGHDYISEAFTLGLLHDFGKIVLFYNFPDEAITFYNREWKPDVDAQLILGEEKEVFGIDHVEAGLYLISELNFLSSMEIAVAFHHYYSEPVACAPHEQYLLNVVVASNKLANAMGFAFNRIISQKAFKEDPFWDNLLENHFFETSDKGTVFQALFDLRERASTYVSEVV